MRNLVPQSSIVLPWLAALAACGGGVSLGGGTGGGGASATSATTSSASTTSATTSAVTSSGSGGADAGVQSACPEGGTILRALPPSSGPIDVAVDATHVYWSSETAGKVERAFKADGANPQVLVEGLKSPRGIALWEGFLYFVQYDPISVPGRVPVTLGAVEWAFDSLGAFPGLDITVQGEHVYFTTEPDDVWYAKNPFDNAYLAFSSNIQARGITSDDQRAYWVNAGGSTVMSSPLGSGVQTTLASGQNIPSAIAVDGVHVFWANEGDGTIRRAEKDTGANLVELASSAPGSRGLAVDLTHVYWTNLETGTVSRVPKDGGSIEVLCTGQGGPYGVALDDEAVYWVNQKDDEVMRFPK